MAVDSLRARTPVPPSLLEEEGKGRPRRVTRLRGARRGVRLSGVAVAALLLLLTGISLLLRIGQLKFHFWIDEGISVGIATHPLSQLPHLLRQDGSPPLYYLLLHVWMQLFGHSEVATHELSLVFALITVPVAYWAGASLFGRLTGAYTAILAAGLPFLTEYAQETRMYSLLLLLSLIVASSFVHAFIFRRRRYLPVFAVSLAASIYTHNWALFLGVMAFVAFAVCTYMSPRALRRGLLVDGLIGFGVAALLYLPWVPTLLYQAKHTGAPWALHPVLWSLSQGGYFIVGGRGAAGALLLGAGAGLWAIRVAGPGERMNRLAVVALMLLGIGTVLFAWAYAKTTPAWAFRYLAVVIGPLLVLFGLGLARGGRLARVALLLACLFWVLDPLTTKPDAKSNVASAAAVVRAQTDPSTVVLSTQPEQVPTLAYYLPRLTHFVTPLGRVADPRVMNWDDALEHFRHASSERRTLVPLLGSLRPGQRVALVTPRRFATAPEWMVLIHRTSEVWTKYMQHDRHLKQLAVTSPYAYSSGLPVRITLYEVR
jgi:mannosyltransferase